MRREHASMPVDPLVRIVTHAFSSVTKSRLFPLLLSEFVVLAASFMCGLELDRYSQGLMMYGTSKNWTEKLPLSLMD